MTLLVVSTGAVRASDPSRTEQLLPNRNVPLARRWLGEPGPPEEHRLDRRLGRTASGEDHEQYPQIVKPLRDEFGRPVLEIDVEDRNVRAVRLQPFHGPGAGGKNRRGLDPASNRLDSEG